MECLSLYVCWILMRFLELRTPPSFFGSNRKEGITSIFLSINSSMPISIWKRDKKKVKVTSFFKIVQKIFFPTKYASTI